ncbi:MAG: hypothetical protein IPM91_03015 [Bacteroidetes bacterium]|nr:hypothetical protein [Bacteroidota bacterium]
MDCDTGVFITHDSMAVILFTAEGYACVDSTACSPNPQLIRGSNANTNVRL